MSVKAMPKLSGLAGHLMSRWLPGADPALEPDAVRPLVLETAFEPLSWSIAPYPV
jgi:hypothetical protein